MKVSVCSASFANNKKLLAELEQHVRINVVNTSNTVLQGQALIDCIADSQAAIIGLDAITEDVLKACPNLKLISKYGVGLDNIDQVACQRHQVELKSSPGVNKRSVAEMTLGFMLTLNRCMYQSAHYQSQGIWHKIVGEQLSEKTVGIIGVGHVGKDLIHLLKPFKCKILVNDIRNQDDYYQNHQLEKTDKKNLFQQADIITLHVPLTEQTQYLINKESLKLFKKTSVLINTSRGKVVHLSDLKEALLNHQIAAAGLDVYEQEPPSDKQLLALPNVFCCSHIGGSSRQAQMSMGKQAILHIIESL